MSNPNVGPNPKVTGRCPMCNTQSLFLGDGGHVTCSILKCRDPGAATDLLSEAFQYYQLGEQAKRFGQQTAREMDKPQEITASPLPQGADHA